ncbi:diguanylate cyclase [Rhodoferax sp.]|uniref:sensor domain-containing diguanylate cyclase n=1 Tax=Rhodoferax sp. TaxID=50421 RepID=UPI00283C3526|nr:diguanylate cyclase [Rhodoferax sp.]MDR3369222.1 diguanylate cyclase [Rhodoferax sp.]
MTPRMKTHWAVRMNHRNRTGGFAMLCLILGLHMAHKDHSIVVWLALVVQFLVYPQLAFWLARRAADPFEAEIRHMQLDALCFGAWVAVLHFPLWIGFVLFTSSAQNLTNFRGARGLVQALMLLIVGCLLAGVAIGWRLELQTDPLVTTLAIVAISLYLIAVALDSYSRSMRLHDTRRTLRANELALQEQLTEIQSLQAELHDQARRDALTGLFNRRQLSDIMDHELARCARDGQPLSLLMIDIDHFKRINDTLGHQVGDEVLRETARLLGERTRASDMLFRYGGEEFLLLMSGDTLTAQELAEELRKCYASSPLTSGSSPVMGTLSIGVSTFADHGVTFDSLIQAADQALYRAKGAGRNRVEIA